MSAILDQGSLLFASLAVLAITALQGPVGPGVFRFYTPLLFMAAFYVPGTLLLARLFGGPGSALFQRDYGPLLTCAAMAWTAANLPLTVAAWLLPVPFRAPLMLPVAGLSFLYFAVLMFFAVRTVFGLENLRAAAVVGLSWLTLAAAAFLWGPLRFLLGWLASPFFLFYAWYYLGNELGNLGAGLRSRQHFHRTLQAAAVNPHDGEAQYQLGLVYQQRRQYSEAMQRFQNAVAIDPKETDAHFQLGRIAREQGRLNDALEHFRRVLEQDEYHSQSEILRELGAMYISARAYEFARQQLVDYVERRPYDPEGLYYYGQALEGLGRAEEAREAYGRAIDAARTAPRYRRRFTAKWSRLAQRRMRQEAIR